MTQLLYIPVPASQISSPSTPPVVMHQITLPLYTQLHLGGTIVLVTREGIGVP